MNAGRRLSRLALVGAAAGAGAAAVAGAGRYLLRRSLPQTSGTLTLAGLREPVEVLRDRWGVPHIYAATEEDLFFAQGYVHAQDRLFQMDANRRVGLGRLAEIVGAAALESDRFARIVGWPRAAEAQVAGIVQDRETASVSAAYAAGVNAFIEEGPLPPEFTLLAYRPERWGMLDSAAWGTVLAWGLSVNWETELLRARLVEQLGPERAADLTPFYSDSYPTIVPDARVGGRLAEALVEAYRQALETLPLGSVPTGPGAGSNNWAISGGLTASGRPILANDPHLPPIFPTIWYENHLVGGRYEMSGFTSPGVPGLIIGHNRHIAWGITNGFPDIQDLYVERFHPEDSLLYEVEGEWQAAEEREEVIHVRGRRSPVVEQVRYTHHGPVISALIPGRHADLALRWMCHDENNHLRALLEVGRAESWSAFRAAVRHWAFPSQNVVYADVEGNIGYIMPGRVPVRKRGDGLIPAPGWSGEYEWSGWINADDLPARFNPSEGFIATANNRVTGARYPYLLSGEWLPPYRAQRIATLITSGAPLDIRDNQAIQADAVSLPARRFLQVALPLAQSWENQTSYMKEQLARLKAWDHEMRADCIAPTLYWAWFVCFTRAAVEQAVGRELMEDLLGEGGLAELAASPFHELGQELALRWLAGGVPEWVGDIRPLLRPSLQEALSTLQRELGTAPEQWQWGRLHYVEFESPLARIPGLGRLWKGRREPLNGDGYTVNQAELSPRLPPPPVQIIASCRMVLDVGAWDNSRSALPGGQSGHPASHHYQDGIDEWLHNQYHPMLFSRVRVEAAVDERLRLLPES